MGGLWLPNRLSGEGPLDDGNSSDRMGDQSHTIKSEKGCCDSRRAHIGGQGENLFQHGSALTAFRVHLYNEALRRYLSARYNDYIACLIIKNNE